MTFSGSTVTATLANSTVLGKATLGRIEVRLHFDDAPSCAVYNGAESGPDAIYAAIPHFGLPAQMWRENVTVS